MHGRFEAYGYLIKKKVGGRRCQVFEGLGDPCWSKTAFLIVPSQVIILGSFDRYLGCWVASQFSLTNLKHAPRSEACVVDASEKKIRLRGCINGPPNNSLHASDRALRWTRANGWLDHTALPPELRFVSFAIMHARKICQDLPFILAPTRKVNFPRSE